MDEDDDAPAYDDMVADCSRVVAEGNEQRREQLLHEWMESALDALARVLLSFPSLSTTIVHRRKQHFRDPLG